MYRAKANKHMVKLALIYRIHKFMALPKIKYCNINVIRYEHTLVQQQLFQQTFA